MLSLAHSKTRKWWEHNWNVNVICLFSLGACNITDALGATRVCSTCLGPSVKKKINCASTSSSNHHHHHHHHHHHRIIIIIASSFIIIIESSSSSSNHHHHHHLHSSWLITITAPSSRTITIIIIIITNHYHHHHHYHHHLHHHQSSSPLSPIIANHHHFINHQIIIIKYIVKWLEYKTCYQISHRVPFIDQQTDQTFLEFFQGVGWNADQTRKRSRERERDNKNLRKSERDLTNKRRGKDFQGFYHWSEQTNTVTFYVVSWMLLLM